MNLDIPKHIMFKLMAWRDIGDTEVTGFFITKKGDMSKVIDAMIIKAECSGATVDISSEAIEAFYLEMAEKEIYPDQLQIWWHTHPGNSASPSGTDESTFKELGQDRTLNMMYILAKGGEEFAQISVTDLASGIMLKSAIAVKHPFTKWSRFPSYETLQKEYDDNVVKHTYVYNNATTYGRTTYGTYGQYSRYDHTGYAYNNYQHNNNVSKQIEEKTTDTDLALADEDAEDRMFGLTSEEIDYLDELHALVTTGELTHDDADALAVSTGYGLLFYTSIYGDDDDDEEETGELELTDPDYILMKRLWKQARTLDAFFVMVEQLISHNKLSQKNANLYLSQNAFSVCYIDGNFVDI